MSAFDRVIGYQGIKEELLQICDMVKNRSVYDEFGVKLPRGILFYGEPGIGKSLIAECFIEECGINAYTVRCDVDSKDLVTKIKNTFSVASVNSPSIVFFDDMDKFANEDEQYRDAEAYVAIQSGIDTVKDSDVIVVATVNNTIKLPESLTRPGRFDRKIEMECPTEEDAVNIIKYYLRDKKLSDDVNINDLSKMIAYKSCAELETILNEAALKAAYNRRNRINMSDLIKAVLRMKYRSPMNQKIKTPDEIKRIALHEAGHLVASEILLPESVGLVSIRSRGSDRTGGFIHRCKELNRRPFEIIVSLAGKAAVELYYCESIASGCQLDLYSAFNFIRDGILKNETSGIGTIYIGNRSFDGPSENIISRIDNITSSELERYFLKTKDILLKNRSFLEKIAAELEEKEVLLFSDIQRIKSETTITTLSV